ncbi:MAG: stage 0 sporulation family protein [Dehalococcoidia bacterium]|nr:stage 0 sporulation family protein [Dehalococcoidia bacterium]
MTKIIQVSLLPRGTLFYCDAGDISLEEGDYVILLDSAEDAKIARVKFLEVQTPADELTGPIMKVLRRAEPEDLTEDRQRGEAKALARCRELATNLNLKMKPLAARYDMERHQFTIFFRAEDRIDFRELVRKLRQSSKARVELRQIGPRDEAKLLGGIGKCGYPLCCQGHLRDFAAVSIKMAKEQGVALNPSKISGLCGRLLCCLSYESTNYPSAKKRKSQLEKKTPHTEGKANTKNTPGKNSA